jgi:hypothetical protein
LDPLRQVLVLRLHIMDGYIYFHIRPTNLPIHDVS